MSETLIASLQKRLDEITTENASLKAENKDRRIKGKSALAELESLREQAQALTAERDALKTRAEAAPHELQATIDGLRAELLGRDHKDAFASVREFESEGRTFKLNEGVSVEDVWQLTQYKPEGATPDGKTVSDQYGKALQARPYLFTEAAPAPGGATRPNPVQAREGGPGPGRTATQILAAAQQGGGRSSHDIPGRI